MSAARNVKRKLRNNSFYNKIQKNTKNKLKQDSEKHMYGKS